MIQVTQSTCAASNLNPLWGRMQARSGIRGTLLIMALHLLAKEWQSLQKEQESLPYYFLYCAAAGSCTESMQLMERWLASMPRLLSCCTSSCTCLRRRAQPTPENTSSTAQKSHCYSSHTAGNQMSADSSQRRLSCARAEWMCHSHLMCQGMTYVDAL